MSITYNATLSPASALMRDAALDTTNNRVVIVENSSNTYRTYSLPSLTPGASGSVTSQPYCVTVVNSGASAIVGGSNSSFDVVQLNTGYKSTVSGTNLNAISTVASNKMAYDPTTGIVIMISSLSGYVVQINTNTFTGSLTYVGTTGTSQQDNYQCVLYKGPGRFLLGSSFGKVVEIDAYGNVYNTIVVGNSPNDGTNSVGGSIAIWSLAYDNNLLLVQDIVALRLYDYSTNTLIKTHTFNNAANGGSYISASSSGICLTGQYGYNTTYASINEVDFTAHPITVGDTLYLNTNTGNILTSGINSNTGNAFAVDSQANKIYSFTLNSRATANHTVTYPSTAPARLIIVDITSSPCSVLLDTYTVSGSTYRVPTGKTILELIKVGDGSVATFDAAYYTT